MAAEKTRDKINDVRAIPDAGQSAINWLQRNL